MSRELGRPRFKTGKARTGWDWGSGQVWPEPRRQSKESGQPGLRSAAGEEVKRRVLGQWEGVHTSARGSPFLPQCPALPPFPGAFFSPPARGLRSLLGFWDLTFLLSPLVNW